MVRVTYQCIQYKAIAIAMYWLCWHLSITPSLLSLPLVKVITTPVIIAIAINITIAISVVNVMHVM